MEKLTTADVSRLLTDKSGDMRATTAAKIAETFKSGLSEGERKLAEDIFRMMVKDAEVRVREALARHLKESPDVPHDVALSLARDVERVALPMLQFSEVLTDDDLVEIVRSSRGEEGKQLAVASRATVAPTVADALVDTGTEHVVGRLVSNEGAQITEQSLQKVVDSFGRSELVQDRLVRRAQLPVTVAERLVTLVSDGLRQHLVTNHELPGALATDLALQTRERAVLGLSEGAGEAEIEALVAQLDKNGRLTPSIILRAMCMGDMAFFEVAMARLVKIPVQNARLLIHDRGSLGFKALYERSGLPMPFFAAMRAAIEVADAMDYDGGPGDRERYTRRMIERVLTQYGDLGVSFEADDLEYLLTKLTQLPLHAER